jgi:hypothetical protein
MENLQINAWRREEALRSKKGTVTGVKLQGQEALSLESAAALQEKS